MKLGSKGAALIKSFEQLRLEAYHGAADAEGVWTIGWGHTGPEVQPGMVITEANAEQLFRQDVADAEKAVWGAVVRAYTTQEQFDAFVSLAFNIGIHGFETSTALRLHNDGKFFDVPAAFTMWRKSAGRARRGLIRRRLMESLLYCDAPFIDIHG